MSDNSLKITSRCSYLEWVGRTLIIEGLAIIVLISIALLMVPIEGRYQKIMIADSIGGALILAGAIAYLKGRRSGRETLIVDKGGVRLLKNNVLSWYIPITWIKGVRKGRAFPSTLGIIDILLFGYDYVEILFQRPGHEKPEKKIFTSRNWRKEDIIKLYNQIKICVDERVYS